MSDLISIIMPVKDAQQWLEECLASIQAQSIQNWELIAVDDHSSDNSLNILKMASEKDERIHVSINNGTGIIDALEAALSLTNGSWISRMDADDLMPPNKLELLFAALDSNEKAVLTGKVKYFGEEEITQGYQEYEDWLNERIDARDHKKWVYRECTIAGANWMTHKDNLDWDSLTYPEDYDLVFHWYKRGCPIVGVSETTHQWRDHSARTSKNSKDYKQEAFFNLKIKRFIELDLDKSKSLFVLGENRKSKLVCAVLNSVDVEYTQLGKEEIDLLGPHLEAQVLVAVYPPAFERKQINKFLSYNRFEEGIVWWWL